MAQGGADQILLLPIEIVKRCLFGGFEFEVLDCIFELGHSFTLVCSSIWWIVSRYFFDASEYATEAASC